MRKLLIVTLVLFATACITSEPIYNVENEPVPSYTESLMPLDVVEKSITTACKRKGWYIRVIEDGVIEASIYGHKRIYTAVVDIHYTEKAYDIRYKSSENLGYNDGKIHRLYNKRIVNLNQAIRQELGSNV